MSPAARRLLPAVGGAVTARLLLAILEQRAAAGTSTWRAVNYAGRPVSLLAGPAVVAAGAGVAAVGAAPARWRLAAVVAATGAAAAGRYDDRHGAGPEKGLAGHLAALRRGAPGTGTVKVLGIGASGLAAGALVRRDLLDAVLAGAVVAGCANLVNLFDLRPGRALKVVVAGSLAVVAGRGGGAELLAGPAGAAAAMLPADLTERTMLGDTGANGLGALVGVGLVIGGRRRRLVALLLGTAALTAASEVVSYSAVIDRVPPLRWVDRLGRPRPPG